MASNVPDPTETGAPDPTLPAPPPPAVQPDQDAVVPAPPPPGGDEPVTEAIPEQPRLTGFVKVDPALVPEALAPKRKPYWCGTLASSPFQNLSFFGIDFPRFEGIVSFDVDGSAQGKVEGGKMHYLTNDQVEGIKASVAKGILRGAGDNWQKLTMSGKGYRSQPNDIPIGKFVFLVPISPSMPYAWRNAEPEPMVD